MGDIIGQLSFGGREVTALKLDVPGFGIVSYSLPDGIDQALFPGDRLRITAEWVVDSVSGREKHDSSGIGTGSLKQIAHIRAIVPETLDIDSVLRREELQALWQAKVAQ